MFLEGGSNRSAPWIYNDVPCPKVSERVALAVCAEKRRETKNQPKEEVFHWISLQTSGEKLQSGLQILEKKQAFWHGHVARTSTKTFRAEKLRADFPFPF